MSTSLPTHHAQAKTHPSQTDIASLLRVDHAGEYGAVRIYQAQLDILGDTLEADTLRDMLSHEKEHLATFDALMQERNVQPTIFQPLWHVMGYALGAATALMGVQTAYACTVAVENVIDEHYAEQERALGDDEKALKEKIRQFRAEEIAHRDIALQRQAEKAPFYPIINRAITIGSKCAIWLSSRF
ncbi:MAG: demethoxyubiquinone hydroxylase family protein [Alphaproteobacteria bacterium GM7ARS4]|nr:demethoxyubiquinone hydroxylase family protein [Alphaproteobacteria bacterium GM7ARS4]